MPSAGLHQQQSLKQVIGPQMQQSLQILQAPALELQQIIQLELAQNPVLEVEVPEVALQDAMPDEVDDEIGNLSKLDEEWREYYAQQRASQASPRTSEDDERQRFLL